MNISTNKEPDLKSLRDWSDVSFRSRILRNQWLVSDQALVSAMNFLTSAVLARMLGVHDFGVFSVFYIILQYLNSIQLALIVSPMMTLALRSPANPNRAVFLKGMGGLSSIVFSAACCAFTVLLAVVEKFHLAPAKIYQAYLSPSPFRFYSFRRRTGCAASGMSRNEAKLFSLMMSSATSARLPCYWFSGESTLPRCVPLIMLSP